MESELVRPPDGWLRGVLGEGKRDAERAGTAGASVSPSAEASGPRSVAPALMAVPQEAQKRASAAFGFPQKVQNIEGASYHSRNRTANSASRARHSSTTRTA